MKTLVLTTVGSTGDVVPHLALALAARARGHRVRVASHSFHREFFERAGVDFVAVGPPIEIADFNRLVDRAAQQRAPIKQFDVLVRGLFLDQAEARYRDLCVAVADADVVVAQRFDYLGQEAAIARGVPWASVTLVPQLIPTREAPVYPAPSLGRLWTQFTWVTLEQMALPTNTYVTSVLGSLGAAPRVMQAAGAASPQLDLVAASPAIVAVRGDWPSSVKVTGAWSLPLEDDYAPPPELAEFLAAHADPIVVTFGSMGGTQAQQTGRLVLDALARLGRPAIVQAGYAGLLASGGSRPDVLAIGHVPHAFLFARAGCIVHHAGAGTTHAVLASGRPSAPVPHLFDQYYWAGRLHEIGVAPKPLFRHQASPRKLAARIEEALSFASPAAKVGARVRAEGGVEVALDALLGALV